jgi:hypothetical protein
MFRFFKYNKKIIEKSLKWAMPITREECVALSSGRPGGNSYLSSTGALELVAPAGMVTWAAAC